MDEKDKQGRVVLLSCFFLHSNALVTVSPATCSSYENDNMKVSRHGIIIIYNIYPLIYLKYLLQKIRKDNLRALDDEGTVERGVGNYSN